MQGREPPQTKTKRKKCCVAQMLTKFIDGDPILLWYAALAFGGCGPKAGLLCNHMGHVLLVSGPVVCIIPHQRHVVGTRTVITFTTITAGLSFTGWLYLTIFSMGKLRLLPQPPVLISYSNSLVQPSMGNYGKLSRSDGLCVAIFNAELANLRLLLNFGHQHPDPLNGKEDCTARHTVPKYQAPCGWQYDTLQNRTEQTTPNSVQNSVHSVM